MTHSFFKDFDTRRDAYGFTVRPQYLQTFKEFDSIYKKEEEERSTKWRCFLEQHAELALANASVEESIAKSEVTEPKTNPVAESSGEGDVLSDRKPTNGNETESVPEKVDSGPKQTKKPVVRNWAEVRSSLSVIEDMMCRRVKSRINMTNDPKNSSQKHLQSIQEEGPADEDSKEESRNNERPYSSGDERAEDTLESSFPWKELESLVRGARRVEGYYQNLLDVCDAGGERFATPEKCRKQIEKDLPRTFPGHPALNEEGRNSLRRLLLAYAQHNPAVGYCQGINMESGKGYFNLHFFRTSMRCLITDDPSNTLRYSLKYFESIKTALIIYSNKSKLTVDQLVFEDLMRERYPKLVLRVWDVILFEGNRAMLLRTALALMELYGTTKDAGDAITLLQSLVGSTFDSSTLVVTACISFSYVTEDMLQQLRQKHRPDVVAANEERNKGELVRQNSKRLATKLYSFKRDPKPIAREPSIKKGLCDKNVHDNSADLVFPPKLDHSLDITTIDSEVDSLPDIQDQVVWLKAQLCLMMEEKRAATLRCIYIEHMEQEVAELQQVLGDKKEQEKAMLEVLMRVEQEQKVTEDARRSAEQDAAAQRYAVSEKYEKAMNSLAQMEKRVVMAESMLEATLQYNSGQVKALSPGVVQSLQRTTTVAAATTTIQTQLQKGRAYFHLDLVGVIGTRQNHHMWNQAKVKPPMRQWMQKLKPTVTKNPKNRNRRDQDRVFSSLGSSRRWQVAAAWLFLHSN
ncbi:Rab-GTPase-TBC domain-containing protein [Cynara cardunculus var. scolymus]|uniref:Rab-GTPase-TBC domain-containing protein n=1 Tax=Cynara cardunculus var. scolymus TaxID=59895 RepID=A0A103XZY3_CYNCS|nr:Rab-GTPase-TBC domain-containing protein [Cynara cardunculus var. scolymus]